MFYTMQCVFMYNVKLPDSVNGFDAFVFNEDNY